MGDFASMEASYLDGGDDPFEAASEAGWLSPDDQSQAMIDVFNERLRQQDDEGNKTSGDDTYLNDELVRAAHGYCRSAIGDIKGAGRPMDWPWDLSWWKPKGRRRDLVRAAALLVAEIERIDRAAVSNS